MVGSIIRLRAPLQPPTKDKDKHGTTENAIIVHHTEAQIRSASRLHRRGRLTTTATPQVPNDKEKIPAAPNDKINSNNNKDNTTQQRKIKGWLLRHRRRQRCRHQQTFQNKLPPALLPFPPQMSITNKFYIVVSATVPAFHHLPLLTKNTTTRNNNNATIQYEI